MYVALRYFVVVARSVLGGGCFLGQASRGFVHKCWEDGAGDRQAVWGSVCGKSAVAVKEELTCKGKLSIYYFYVLTLTYGHELWLVTERTWLWIQAAETRRVAGLLNLNLNRPEGARSRATGYWC